MGETKDRVINLKDVKTLKYADGEMVIESEKSGIRIRASKYDHNKILRRWEPPPSTEEPSE